MMGLPDVILTALDVHAVQTADEYRFAHRRQIAQLHRVRPKQMPCAEPWPSEDRPPVIVDGGVWKIACTTSGCTNYPAVEPVSGLACCWDCGALYTGLRLPAEAAQIEAVLVLRQGIRRGWRPGESIEQLEDENKRIGAPLPPRGEVHP